MSTQPGAVDLSSGVVKVLQGQPTPEEIAAVSVVLAAMSGGTGLAITQRRGWSHRRRALNPGTVRGMGWGGPS